MILQVKDLWNFDIILDSLKCAFLVWFQVGALAFPPKKLFSRSEKVVSDRQKSLEVSGQPWMAINVYGIIDYNLFKNQVHGDNIAICWWLKCDFLYIISTFLNYISSLYFRITWSTLSKCVVRVPVPPSKQRKTHMFLNSSSVNVSRFLRRESLKRLNMGQHELMEWLSLSPVEIMLGPICIQCLVSLIPPCYCLQSYMYAMFWYSLVLMCINANF